MDMEQIERVIRVPLEDTSDVSILRSRIDQQTHLIAILKQRSDDTLRKVSIIMRINTLFSYVHSISGTLLLPW